MDSVNFDLFDLQDLDDLAFADDYVDDITSMELPMNWENVYEEDVRTQGVYAESISDALLLSLANLGVVDIEYIAAVTGEDYKTVISELKGAIYQNPLTWNESFYKGWESAEEYLSGNLRRKLREAQNANKKYNGYFEDNIRALKNVLPPVVSAEDIYITIGSPWVPNDVMDDFVKYILKVNTYCGIRHDEVTGTWEVPGKSAFFYGRSIEARHTYGTDKMAALEILEKTLNMKTVAVYDEVESKTSKNGKKKVVNKAETVLALEKQQKLIQTFQSWVWTDGKRRKRLEQIFEEKFSSVRRRIFDGSFLKFPTMNPDIRLYSYQKDAVARILFSANTLLAHDVGSGKTFIMAVAGMELKRMGLSSKNLYVVPNNIVGQWNAIFKKLYPQACILCVEPKNFTPAKRKEVLKRIQNESFDAIIMADSCVEQIPLSNDFYVEELLGEKEEINEIENDYKKRTSKLLRKKEKIEQKLKELHTLDDPEDLICFDRLGITRLFVDEAHNYKNLPIDTQISKVSGISAGGSKKCKDMLDKVHYVQKQNNGGGVVMATGTPITNSITDIYVMQQYLQSGELKLLDLQSFDSWVGMFGERTTEFEIDVDTSSYRLATRFSKFHNLPELTVLLSAIADFHQVDPSAGIPETDGYEDSLVPKTQEFQEYLNDISERVDMIRKGYVNRCDDNMLKVTTDGRKAALDLRLAVPEASFTFRSKVAYCAEDVYDIYRKTSEQRSTQLVFCDSSTPKNDFNLYDELKRLLVDMGVPEQEIAFVHSASTEAQRTKLFEEVRNGNIRILIGSTFKLGMGVNVQDKLVAIHHLDVPWRPADMVQREGRILRQGNENEKVYIYRYITEGSFDAYSWQLLETKQRFISDLLSGSIEARSGSDIDNAVLDYAEVKALAVGNPLIKERVEVANELSRYYALQRKTVERHIRLEQELAELPDKIAKQETLIEQYRKDLEDYKELRREYNKDERKAVREKLYEAIREHILASKEKSLMDYQGFRIVLPANMILKEDYVYLDRNGRHKVEIGNSQVGGLIRIDNYLEGLTDEVKKEEEVLEKLLNRQVSVRREVLNREDYADKITEMKNRLEKLDEQLGVERNE